MAKDLPIRLLVVAYWENLIYILLHKWYVLVAGMPLGVPFWQLLIHDWTKFLPYEFHAYAVHFYRLNHEAQTKTEIHVPGHNTHFDVVWCTHTNREPHHPNHWVVSGPLVPDRWQAYRMPQRFIREMIADWYSAGRMHGHNDPVTWYERNGHRLPMHIETRAEVERLLAEFVPPAM